MTRVILTLLLIGHSFCLRADGIRFTEPGLLGHPSADRPRVVVVKDAAATVALAPQADVVAGMVERGIMAFTGQATPGDAWRSLVSTQDVVGVKVYSLPGPVTGTRPAVVAAVARGLKAAGVAGDRIVIWDRRLEDLRAAGFDSLAASLGVRLAGAADAGFDPGVWYENPVLGQPVFGDLEFSKYSSVYLTNAANHSVGRNSYLTRLLTREFTKLINIAPLLNHNTAGVSGILYTVASAATDNFLRFEVNPSLLERAVPEIYGQPQIADRVAVNIVDALIGQYEGRQRSLLHYSMALNELRFSSDPVALDVLSLADLNRARATMGVTVVTNRFELYLNARLMELGADDFKRMDILRVD